MGTGIENLIPFQPGQSGNPNGRPIGIKNRSTILREILALADKDGKTNEYKVIEALCTKAQDGDVPAIKEVQDTMYGKLADKIQEVPPEPERDLTDEFLDTLTLEQLEALKLKAATKNSPDKL